MLLRLAKPTVICITRFAILCSGCAVGTWSLRSSSHNLVLGIEARSCSIWICYNSVCVVLEFKLPLGCHCWRHIYRLVANLTLMVPIALVCSRCRDAKRALSSNKLRWSLSYAVIGLHGTLHQLLIKCLSFGRLVYSICILSLNPSWGIEALNGCSLSLHIHRVVHIVVNSELFVNNFGPIAIILCKL